MQTPLPPAGADAPAPPKPRGGRRALAGRGASHQASLSVPPTHAPLAGKVQREVRNGVVNCSPPDHLWIGAKSRQPCQPLTNIPLENPAGMPLAPRCVPAATALTV